ncbi:hypothetical protein BS17DRAFT_790306 [Gyrodon lividus]|nr:hypothetical protein BS17DRAFT_790306 [Gyrodon lividus]
MECWREYRTILLIPSVMCLPTFVSVKQCSWGLDAVALDAQRDVHTQNAVPRYWGRARQQITKVHLLHHNNAQYRRTRR